MTLPRETKDEVELGDDEMETWSEEEGLTEEEVEELEGRFQTECDAVTVRGVVQGMVEEWG